jgi:hypothetical protein
MATKILLLIDGLYLRASNSALARCRCPRRPTAHVAYAPQQGTPPQVLLPRAMQTIHYLVVAAEGLAGVW